MHETISARVSFEFKRTILERCTALKMTPSQYLISLIKSDLDNQDITKNDKPLLTEFSQKVAEEFFQKMSSFVSTIQTDSMRVQEMLFALLFYNFRVSLLSNQTISSRLKYGLKMEPDDARKSDEEMRNNFNAMLEKFTGLFENAEVSNILEFAKKKL